MTPHSTHAERPLRELMASGPVHFMGISGAGMSALAEAMARQGARITGCDWAPGIASEPLRKLGIPVFDRHDPAHVEGVAALVVTAAIPGDHPEVARAHELRIPVLKRARVLADWVNDGFVAAVAGTHGKTTTTAMLTEILARAGKDPTGFVGGWVSAWSGHLRPGRDDLFVVEADEYDRSFHHLRPSLAVVTNVEPDHLDIYGDLDGVRAGFRTFVEGTRPGGTVVASFDDPGAGRLLASVALPALTFGLGAGSEVRGVALDPSARGTRFRVIEKGEDRGWFHVRIPGEHNVRNALAAAAAARVVGVDWQAIRSALADFIGVVRRFQVLGEASGVTVVDDYAHHPTELASALSAAQDAYPDRRIVAVFQPHLFSRTRDFADEFAEILATADVTWITEIYPAREPPIPGIDGAFLANRVKGVAGRSPRSGAGVGRAGRVAEVRFHGDLATLSAALARDLRPGDLCLTLGAGSIEQVGPELVEHLKGRSGPIADRMTTRDASDGEAPPRRIDRE